MPSPKFTAIVRKKVTFRRPALNTSGKQILLGPDGKELAKDDQNNYVGTGTPKWDVTETESTVDPLMDDAGNPVEAGTADALLRAVKAHFADEDETEVLKVSVQETKIVQEMTGADLSALK